MADDVTETRLVRIEGLLERAVSDLGKLVSLERYQIEQSNQDRRIEELAANVDKVHKEEINTRRWLVAVFLTLVSLIIAVYTKT